MGSILDILTGPITAILNKVLPDKSQQEAAQAALAQLQESDEFKAAEDQLNLQLAAMANVKAEAQGQSWLQRNWRPMVALFLMGLLGAHWFGLTIPNLSAAEIADLYDLEKICLGGYFVARSVEKVATTVTPAVTAALKK